MFEILTTDEAKEQLNGLRTDKGLTKRYKAVKKSLLFLSENPKFSGITVLKKIKSPLSL